MRVRSFTQDDAHIFMREDQVMDEIQGVMRLIQVPFPIFGGLLLLLLQPYTDIHLIVPLLEEHLKTIESEMRKIVKESLSLQVYEKSKEEALSFMENADEK